jgi:hypothetical protein
MAHIQVANFEFECPKVAGTFATGTCIQGTAGAGSTTLSNRPTVLWHVDPLLGNDQEISSYTTAVARKWPQQIRNMQRWSNCEAVFSTRSVR